MTRPMNSADRWLDGMARVAMWVAAAGLVLMTAVIGWQVFGRKVLNASPAWSESLALLLMLYFVLLASAAGVREGFHLRFRLIDDVLSDGAATLVRRVVNLGVAAFGVLMTVNGIALANFTAGHLIPTLGVSRAVAYWPFVIAGALITVFAADNAFRDRLAR